MATKTKAKAKAKAKGGTSRKNNPRRPRKGNPGEGLALAFAGGIVGRVIDGVARYGANMATAKSPSMAAPVRVLAALVPAVAAVALEEHAPQFSHGMAGSAGAAFTEEVVALLAAGTGGKPPASWASMLAIGDRLQLADGGYLFADDKGVGQYQGPTAAGQTAPPAPTPIKLGAPVTFRTNDGRTFQALSNVASGGVLVRDRNGAFDVLRGTDMVKLAGLVRQGNLVRVR